MSSGNEFTAEEFISVMIFFMLQVFATFELPVNSNHLCVLPDWTTAPF